jgi:uncharacterized repeat protein (TIGR02543 family)
LGEFAPLLYVLGISARCAYIKYFELPETVFLIMEDNMRKIILGAIAVCVFFTLLGCPAEPETEVVKKITISFDLLYDGAPDAPQSRIILKGGQIGSLPAPERSGYIFIGWFKYLANGQWEKVVSTNTFETSTVLYARWGAAITLSFDLSYVWGPEPPEPVTIPAEYEITNEKLPVVTREGFDFLGWFTEYEGGTKITGTSILYSDTYLYAHWDDKRESITLTFNMNHEDAVSITPPSPVQVKPGDIILTTDLPVPKITPLLFFKGWYTEPTGGELVAKGSQLYESKALYAKWVDAGGFALDLSNWATTQNAATFGNQPTYSITDGVLKAAMSASGTSAQKTAQCICIKLTTTQRDELYAWYQAGNPNFLLSIDGYCDKTTNTDDIQFRVAMGNETLGSSWNGAGPYGPYIFAELLDSTQTFNTLSNAAHAGTFILQNRSGGTLDPFDVYIRSIYITWDPTVEEEE